MKKLKKIMNTDIVGKNTPASLDDKDENEEVEENNDNGKEVDENNEEKRINYAEENEAEILNPGEGEEVEENNDNGKEVDENNEEKELITPKKMKQRY
ncbi:hypothetical protein QE152_g37689 [Popillia japonica]|uniref:Uncharacterized protein n=1 Tax=Popillia japonica TaxID=7064 RepID=A0AAW1I8X7_POPJA